MTSARGIVTVADTASGTETRRRSGNTTRLVIDIIVAVRVNTCQKLNTYMAKLTVSKIDEEKQVGQDMFININAEDDSHLGLTAPMCQLETGTVISQTSFNAAIGIRWLEDEKRRRMTEAWSDM
jgi:hypothetical protein